jgi:5'-3' exonuclease
MTRSTHALIDGDLISYSCSAACEGQENSIAMMTAERLLIQILDETKCQTYDLFLTGDSPTFRKQLTPTYKANRLNKPRPTHLPAVRKFLVTQCQAQMCEGYEADDALGMNQNLNSIICSFDKDLLQVPGLHWNWKKQILKEVTPDEGLKNFYTQTLVGDVADNVFGIRGVGPVKAARMLDGLDPCDYYAVCREAYDDVDRFHMNCKLLWVWRSYGDVFVPPKEGELSFWVGGEVSEGMF